MESKKGVADFEVGEGLIQLPNENEINYELASGIIKLTNELGKSEYREFVIDRSKSQQEIDTQIGRIADEFQKNESPEESYELGSEEYQNFGGGKQ